MTAPNSGALDPARSRRWPRLLTIALICLGLLGFLAANAHFLFVAMQSQPDCVDHIKMGESQEGAFSAANSSC